MTMETINELSMNLLLMGLITIQETIEIRYKYKESIINNIYKN